MNRYYLPALRGLFGDWVYYSCLMPMKEVVTYVSFGDDIHRSERLSDMIQRELKKGRSQAISAYLQREQQRFFNSLVVAVYGGKPSWHGFEKFRALHEDINISEIPDDVENSVGFLSFSGEERMFALDGQHRLAGMLDAIKSNNDLGRDEVPLIVVAHRDTEDGRIRTRRLFTTLNKTAKPVGKGEIIALDENDVMAITTRHLIENNPFFREGRIRFIQSDNLPANNVTELTTIGNLYDILATVFSEIKGGRTSSGLKYVRPSDDELQEYIDFAEKYFCSLMDAFPPLKQYMTSLNGEDVLRKFRHENGGHILFRPVGLRVITEVIAKLIRQGVERNHAFELASKLPTDISMEPYAGVIWLPEQRKINSSKRALARQLLLYMLDVRSGSEDKLLQRYANQLGIDIDSCKFPDKIVESRK